MPATKHKLTLIGANRQHVTLSHISHQGNGSYTCKVQVDSDGFICDRPFIFDNDEYFLAKLKELQANQTTQAELLDLQNDNYLRIEAVDLGILSVSGLIIDAPPFAQSLEFAFATDYERLSQFINDFGQMLQTQN